LVVLSWAGAVNPIRRKNMRKLGIFLAVSVICFLMISKPLSAASGPPVEGGKLPEIKLSIPKSLDEKSYLGLEGEGTFNIPQIKARVVVIEILNMYCPHCQAAAPRVNELYQAIENNPDLKDKIKLIGIGAGNTPFEIDIFRKKYKILFPLFPDADFSIHDACGQVPTPYFMSIKINEDGSHKVIYSRLGGFDDAKQFLDLMLKLSR
jgi:thiol-disulfide isomerase/thioredoxin